jgi:hypothetical protein
MDELRKGRAMRRGKPRSLTAILQKVAAGAGETRLEEAALGVAVRTVLGGYLARRLVDCRLDGERLILEMGDAAMAREVRRASAEVLKGLARRMPVAPRYVHVTVVSAGLPAPLEVSPKADTGPSRVSAPQGPLTMAALARVGDPDMRRRLRRWVGSVRNS